MARLTVTFNGALDEDAVPVGSAFTVKATRLGTERDVALVDTHVLLYATAISRSTRNVTGLRNRSVALGVSLA